MSQKTKTIILFLVLALILSGIVFYFLRERREEKKGEEKKIVKIEDLLEFKNYDQSLSPAQVDKYFQEFLAVKNVILNNLAALNPSSWLMAARLKKYVKDYEGAEKIYLFLIQRDPENYLPEGNLADLYANYLHNYAKAVEHYWQAVKKTGPNKATALFYYRNLADIYAFELKDKGSEFEEKALLALKNDYPDSVDFLTLLAKYYKDRGQKEKAIEYLEQAQNLDPANQMIKDEIGQLKE